MTSITAWFGHPAMILLPRDLVFNTTGQTKSPFELEMDEKEDFLADPPRWLDIPIVKEERRKENGKRGQPRYHHTYITSERKLKVTGVVEVHT